MAIAAKMVSCEEHPTWAKLCAARDKQEAVDKLSTKLKRTDGTECKVNYVFKDRYVDEYTGEELPLQETKEAIANELS